MMYEILIQGRELTMLFFILLFIIVFEIKRKSTKIYSFEEIYFATDYKTAFFVLGFQLLACLFLKEFVTLQKKQIWIY